MIENGKISATFFFLVIS